MTILYLTGINIDVPSNLLNKMNAQIEEWANHGHKIFVASFPLLNVDNNQVLISQKASGYFIHTNDFIKKLNGGLFSIGNKILSVKKYKKYIHDISPDIIYVREMVGFPGMLSLLKKNKVVLESNTLLMDETRLNSKKLYPLARWYQNDINKNIDGFIGVTNEISNQFIKYRKPTITITNGIKIEDHDHMPPCNKRAQVVMVCTPNLPWHGDDKYIRMAELLPGVDFHLIGPPKENTGIPLKNLLCHGYITGNDLKNIYSKMDIGVGTLALHRKSMNEACPLKVREYAAYGLPMILAYEDTDFSYRDYDFILQIENSEENIEDNLERIAAFIEKWKGRRVPAERVEPLISIACKEKMRLDFFQKILE